MKRKTDNFNKFFNPKNNAQIKESFRQEKKAAKKERKEGIERHFQDKRTARESKMENQAPASRSMNQAGRSFPAEAKGANPAGKGAVPTGKGSASTGKGTAGKFRFDDKDAQGAPTYRGSATPSVVTTGEQLPLNKYIAHSGVCSRRDAADLIRKGKVSVNGKVITEPGTKVVATDTVKVDGRKLTISRNFVYILLNKPKDYITTTDDPQGRKTVLDLIRQATPERVYPVGRLDRNTSGVLLLTNDGDLSQKLAHPSHEIKKIYHVTLDKALTKGDFDKIINGVTLEDGPAHVDVLAYADPKDKMQIGIEIHSGRNRIVRRIFEHLGYDVRGLDRVTYAGLTKKDVQRGKWRFLTEKEIRILKYLNSSIKGSAARAKDWAANPNAAAPNANAKTPNTNNAAAKAAPDRKSAGAEVPANQDPEDRKAKPAPTDRKHTERKPFTDRKSAPDRKRPASDRSERPAGKSRPPRTGAPRPATDRKHPGTDRKRPTSDRPARSGAPRPSSDRKHPATGRPSRPASGRPARPSASGRPATPKSNAPRPSQPKSRPEKE